VSATWVDDLLGGHAPDGLRAWASHHDSFASAWEACERADWLLWMASRLPHLDADDERRLVRVAAACGPEHRPLHQTMLDALRPTPRPLDVALAWADAAPRFHGPDWVVVLNLACLSALAGWRLLGPPGLIAALGVGLLVWGWRKLALERQVAALSFAPAFACAFREATAGVAAAGPRARRDQAVLARESLAFVRQRVASDLPSG
jgi:hypothetical protein